MIILTIYLAVIFVMSVIAFFTYIADKKKAKNNSWRIRESVLLGLGIFGGALGALTAMEFFRHKTKHWYFWAVNIIALIFHIAAAVFICIFFI